jgi:uncharacterized protein YndB with AHSA1/START domain
MSDRSVTHATFSLERTYQASPARVFAAWADPAAKARWFHGPDEWQPREPEMDFRVGGHERTAGGPKGGPVFTYDARYQDIVPDERIVLTYEMRMDDTRISVSVATVELTPADAGTRLVYTEQGAFLDGHDSPEDREQGTNALLDALGAVLQGARASA